MDKITAILQLLLTQCKKGRFFFSETFVYRQEILVIFPIIAGFFLAGCNLFGNNSTSQKRSARQQIPETVSNEQAEDLLKQLDEKFARLDALRVQLEGDRLKEEAALAREYEELRKLRNEMQLWIKARREAVAQPGDSNSRQGYSDRTGRYQSEPVEDRNFSGLNDLDDNSEAEAFQPLRINRDPIRFAESSPKKESVAPPPFLESERKTYQAKPEPADKALPLLPNDGGISPPPFAVSAKPRLKAPVKTAPPEPTYFTPTPRTTAKPEGSLRVTEVKGAPLGRILNVEGKGDKRRILLDIGSKEGLVIGSLVSVGGIGVEYGIWQIDSVENYSSRASHLPESARRTPTTGTYVHVVRIDTSK